MRFGNFELVIIRESTFKIDGGIIFEMVPKIEWSKRYHPDSENRIKAACNLLLIKTEQGCVLIQTGLGERWEDKERSQGA
jgi:hypothetical protein